MAAETPQPALAPREKRRQLLGLPTAKQRAEAQAERDRQAIEREAEAAQARRLALLARPRGVSAAQQAKDRIIAEWRAKRLAYTKRTRDYGDGD